MAKTYEALMRIKKEKKINYLKTIDRAEKSLIPVSDNILQIASAPEWYKELKARLLLANGNKASKALLFTGASKGAGCSHVAVEFASCLANDYQHRVLLIDVNVRKPNLHKIFGTEKGQVIDDLIFRKDLNPNMNKVETGNLFVITCNSDHNYKQIIDFFGSDKFIKMIEQMKSHFDYIIMDAPPVNIFSESKLLSSKVDGVILVAECGRTRRKVVQKAKKDIKSSGGQLLGLILNKRKYHIPGWLYDRL